MHTYTRISAHARILLFVFIYTCLHICMNVHTQHDHSRGRCCSALWALWEAFRKALDQALAQEVDAEPLARAPVGGGNKRKKPMTL